MYMLAFLTKMKRRHMPTTISALYQHNCSIFTDHDFHFFQDQRCKFSIMIQNHLQIFSVAFLTFIQFQTIPHHAPFNKACYLDFRINIGQFVKTCMILFEGVLSKRIAFMISLHNNPNIIKSYFMTTKNAKLFGSKLIDSHQSYKGCLASNNPAFNQKMKMLVNQKFDQVEQLHILQRINEPTMNLFYFYAQKYDSNLRQDIENYLIQQIDHFSHNFESTFAIVYVHSSIFDFIAFRKMLQKWPQHFFHQLRKVYILGASFMVKVVQTFSFGTFYRLCDQIFLNVQNKQMLQEQDRQLLNSIGQTQNKGQVYKKSLKIIQNKFYGKMLQDYELSYDRYPTILLDLLSRIIRDPNALRLQGIFRKSCDSDQLQRLQNQIVNKDLFAIQKEQDLLVVCGCFKKILNNLHQPLFNYQIYAKIINFQSGDQIEFIRYILKDMEDINHKVFILITMFLVDFIISQKEYNKMNSYNLAVIFGPCFFRPKQYDLKDLVYSGKFAKVLVTSFDRHDQLFEASEISYARKLLKNLGKSHKKMISQV